LRALLSTHEDRLNMPHRAELAWLDGLLATTRNQREMLADARRRLRALAGNPPAWNEPLVVRSAEVPETRDVVIARMFDTSLQAFELALGGDALRAGEMLAELERQRGEHDWTRGVAWLHPYLTGINRLAAARWLRESGRPADAERLLRWSEGVEFPGYLVSEARALLDAPVYHERALAAEALGGSDVALSHYAQFLRRYDSPIDAHRDLVERAERIMRETPRDR
jgi:hypothetical protein